MMCARLLGRDRQASRLGAAFDRGFKAVHKRYVHSLGWVLDHGPLILIQLVSTVALNVYMFIVVPKGFLPQQDTGQLRGGIRGDAVSSFQLMETKLKQVVKIVQADPAVATVVGTVGVNGGPGGGGGGASGNMDIALKPRSQRNASADQVIARLRPQLARVTGVVTFLQAQQDIGGGGGGRGANAQYQYTLLGDDLSELRTWSARLRDALQDVPEVTDVDSDLQPGGLETDLILDSNTAANMGLSVSPIDNTLGDSFSQALVSTIYNPYSPQQYRVVMEVAPEYWQSPATLREMYVSTAGGAVGGTASTQLRSVTTGKKSSAAAASGNSATAASAATAATAAAIWTPTPSPTPAAAVLPPVLP